MGMLKVEGVVHWSIPVNDLEEAEKFYQNVLGLGYKGRLGGSRMACVTAGTHSILLCERKDRVVRTPEQDNRLHHSFEVTPEMFDRACKLFHEHGIRLAEPIVYRERGVFPGLELCDPTWKPGMPTPTYEEIVGA
ncbi:MAG: hypothetical protein DMD91_30930 [Candidatus Rokuibacteriota bacterium]|nr:MAG: hypothetical protein DMD91_30930 [Candidatus Rokubacteria bacterium]